MIASAARSIARHQGKYPFAANLSLISIPIGLLAIFVGQNVSRAFSLVFHRPEPIYIWGVVLLLGGCHVAYGVIRSRPSTERAGLFVLAAAYAFYGVSVIVGLEVAGLVAGPTFVVLALSCVQRARAIQKRTGGD